MILNLLQFTVCVCGGGEIDNNNDNNNTTIFADYYCKQTTLCQLTCVAGVCVNLERNEKVSNTGKMKWLC